jgi:WD40 repeat protein
MIAALGKQAEGQGKVGTLKIRLAKEFRDAYLLAVAPDSQKICLYFAENPIDKFTFQGGKWTYEGGPSKQGNEALEVIDIDSWRALCSVTLRQRPSRGSFFADSQVLYVATDPIASTAGLTQHVVIDLQTRNVTEHLQKSSLHESYYALAEQTLLGTESVVDAFARYESLTRTSLPDYRDVVRVPFSPAHKRENGPSWVVTSSDRKTVLYGVDHTLVCRRTEDLEIIWTRQIEREFEYGVMFLAITPDGSRVAASVLDTVYVPRQRKFYIAVYDGKDGRQLARLPLNGLEGIALSPDGNVLAVGKTAVVKGVGSVLTAELYEIATGRRVAVVEDDRFSRLDLAHFGGFGWNGIQFSSDGKYLITSITGHTKVWALDPPLAKK